MSTTPSKPSALIKPTLDTKFNIDYSWWERSDEGDLKTYLLSHLSPEQREKLGQSDEESIIDYVDADTGEVFQVNELQREIQIAIKQPDFINPQISVVDNIFRVFLATNNQPLSPRELETRIDRPAASILKMLSGSRIYKGIRPTQNT